MQIRDFLVGMTFSLGQRLRSTRELLGMTQEQVIEQLENRFDIVMSQQTISTLETGKRKVDAEKELPVLAAIYGRPIDYFYKSLNLPTTTVDPSNISSTITVNFDTLTQRDKLELAAELIHNILQATQPIAHCFPGACSKLGVENSTD